MQEALLEALAMRCKQFGLFVAHCLAHHSSSLPSHP